MAHLTVLGLGLRCPQQITRHAWDTLSRAQQLFFISDHLEKQSWLAQLNPNFYDLMVHYGKGKPRSQTYQEMADKVLECLDQGKDAALVSYGHPLVFCDPSRLAIEQVRNSSHSLKILPGLSSIDCLLADLRVDTQNYGLQIYEGHDLLLHGIQPDPSCSQIVFQIPSLGDNAGYWKPGRFRGFLQVLCQQLAAVFGWEHPAVLYFGANAPGQSNRIETTTLGHLPGAELVSEYTLWVPPIDYPRLTPQFQLHNKPVDLELLGLGFEAGDQTLEVEELLQSARATTLHDPAQLANLTPPLYLCFAGHPSGSGAIAWARQAERLGWTYRIRPGISAEDRLYCDVPLDPGLLGFQSFPLEAPMPQERGFSTLLRQSTPKLLDSSARFWGPISGLTDQPNSDTQGMFLPGPSPRPIVNDPFLRALHLSAVERLEAFLEDLPEKQLQEIPRAASPKVWAMRTAQWAQRRLQAGLVEHALGEDWARFLLQNPDHPVHPYLLLRLRCDEAVRAMADGVCDGPLRRWLERPQEESSPSPGN